MMRSNSIVGILLCMLLLGGSASGSDHEETVPYYRNGAFNVPILEGWTNLSGADYAQFELAEAQAIIRTELVTADDGIRAAQAALGDLLGQDIGQPVYSDKVNLADGTWHVLVFDIDEATSASSMARRSDSGVIVITFVERDLSARTVLLTITQADDSRDEADPEIAVATETLAGIDLIDLEDAEVIGLASGAWRVFRRPTLTAMGMVFGNESYLALRTGRAGRFRDAR